MSGEYTLHPQGELDVATVEGLRQQWLDEVDARQPDSTGLGAIVALQRRQRPHGGVVAIANATPMVAKILQLTGMHLTMEVNGEAPPAREG